jgi:hypothetical protein
MGSSLSYITRQLTAGSSLVKARLFSGKLIIPQTVIVMIQRGYRLAKAEQRSEWVEEL